MDVGTYLNGWSMRAINIVRRSSQLQWQSDELLATWISADAEFSLGSGDVGMPLSPGVAGLHELAKRMNATEFRYIQYGGIPFQVDEPCEEVEVKVEFIRPSERFVYPVKFVFRDGVLVSAKGWTNWYHSGPMIESSEFASSDHG